MIKDVQPIKRFQIMAMVAGLLLWMNIMVFAQQPSDALPVSEPEAAMTTDDSNAADEVRAEDVTVEPEENLVAEEVISGETVAEDAVTEGTTTEEARTEETGSTASASTIGITMEELSLVGKEQESPEPAKGDKVWPFLAVGGKIGASVSGMYADVGIYQLPTLGDGSYYMATDHKMGFRAHFAYMAHAYMTIIPMIQVQAEFLFSVFKGMDNNFVVHNSLDYQNSAQKQPYFIQLNYFQVPILFRFVPDLKLWLGQDDLDFYFLTGPTLCFLEHKAEQKFLVEIAGNEYTASQFFTDDVGVFDLSWTIAIGYTIKQLSPYIPFVDPIVEFRAEFGLLDLNGLKTTGGGMDSVARNWTIYFMIGADYDLISGTLF